MLKIVEVDNQDKLVDFINFPITIYSSSDSWPGMDFDTEMALHNPEQNFALNYLQTKLFLAVKNGTVVGRISAIINEVHNKLWEPNVGFFGHFECINDESVAKLLLNTAEQWVKDHGKEIIIGPFNYTYYGVIGLAIDKFDSRPTVDLPFNPDYYPAFLEKLGYGKYKDLLDIVASVPSFVKNVKEKIAYCDDLINGSRYKLRTLDESNLREEFLHVYDIYNEAFAEVWPFGITTQEEWLKVFEAVYPLFPNEYFLIVEEQGKPVAFFFAEPDYYEEMYNKRHGIDAEIQRIKAFVIGLRNACQGAGISKWILHEFAHRLEKSKYKEVSFSWIGAENIKSVNVATAMGGSIDKVYRVFSKRL